jgi:glycosyltransferase involved in cell wall biosynthesis
VSFPGANDSGTIASIDSRRSGCLELTPDYEVIVVNDGSADATPQIVDELAHVSAGACHPSPEEPGLRRRARSIPIGDQEFVFYTDGDAHDPAELAVLWV